MVSAGRLKIYEGNTWNYVITYPTGNYGITAVIDGYGSVISTGTVMIIMVPYTGTIESWNIMSDVVGSIVVDVKKSTYSEYPSTTSIAASAKPTLSSSQKNQNTTLSGWSKSVSSGDILEFYVNSATTVTKVWIDLTIQGV